jgi:hypothetical protein
LEYFSIEIRCNEIISTNGMKNEILSMKSGIFSDDRWGVGFFSRGVIYGENSQKNQSAGLRAD